jgi:uncharacterized protein YgiM (DUF1202 family)
MHTLPTYFGRIALISVISAEMSAIAFHGPSVRGGEPEEKAQRKSVPAYVAVEHEKPRVRGVHANKAIVRSGPSDQYYATLTLTQGAVVDVYLETSDGWSGIRPPVGSHDWIPASVAYILPGGKSAEIIEVDTPAWIGSDSPNVSEFMWQSSLTKSQQVQILGEEMQMNDDGKKNLWYRIAPPQGEFRWIKSSQLSDSITPADPPSLATQRPDNTQSTQPKKKADAAQLASYAEPVPTADEANNQVEGKIVWSDEQEVLAQVQQQIKKEQADVQRKMVADGVPIEATHQETSNAKSKSPGTKMRPSPANSTRNKQLATAHQTDSMRQWDSMQTNQNPKLRVGPVGSVLGLIGISVVEADRAPVNTHIAQQFHSTPSQGNLARIGPVGANRLDRLPRPGYRGPTMAMPPDGLPMSTNGIMQANVALEANRLNPFGRTEMAGPSAPQPSPYRQGESTFSRLINGNEPLFGGKQTATGPVQPLPDGRLTSGPMFYGVPSANGNQATLPTQFNTISQDTSAWHGLSPSMRTSHSSLSNSSTHANDAVDTMDGSTNQDEFQTPEIQSALAKLTQEIASPTEKWNLTPFRNQAAQWIENGSTAMVRGEARLLMERVERFESLQQRTLGMVQDTSLIAQRTAGNAANNDLYPSSQPNNVVTASAASFSNNSLVTRATSEVVGQAGDASGWLVQVHTSNPGQPEFALTDDTGNVITYVQSSAGLNLRRYLQQPVMIQGVRGYIPGLAAKQILAERVVRMR